MNANVNMSENKNNNNNNSIETTAITADNSDTIHMSNVTTSSSMLAADVTSAATVLTPTITVVEAAVAASSTVNNNTLSLPATASNASTNSTMNGVPIDGETQNMRLILPVFIQNERKYSQPERQRKIQSSPVKSMRRFSQDSSELLGKHLNVSRPKSNRSRAHSVFRYFLKKY